jgi:pentatricopeptide repeat protein
VDGRGAVWSDTRASLGAQEAGVEPTLPLMSSVMYVLAAAGDADRAVTLYAEAAARGLVPDAMAATTLFATCRTRAHWRVALDAYEAFPTTPDRPMYNALVAAAGRCGEWQSALQVRVPTRGGLLSWPRAK